MSWSSNHRTRSLTHSSLLVKLQALAAYHLDFKLALGHDEAQLETPHDGI